MPKLPDEFALQRRNIGANSPGISVRAPDYSIATKGFQDAAAGANKMIDGVLSLQKVDDDVDDYETRKRLLEFKLATEMDLEESKRAMQPGGDGFGVAFRESFTQKARDFVGKDDAHIPERQRAKVGMLLKKHEVALSERAQRYELSERDRFHIDGLETQLGTLRDAVGTAPDRRDEMAADGRRQIELSRIPVADKYRLAKKYEKTLDQTHATARMMSIQTMEDRERFRKELRLDQEDVGGATDGRPSFAGQGGPAAVRFNNPGAQYPGPSATKFGAVGTEIIGGGHKIAVFPDAVSGAAAQFDLLATKYAGKSVRDAISQWSGGNSVDTYLAVVQRETGIKPNQTLTREMLSNPEIAVPLAKAMATQEAGKAYPLSDSQWAQAHVWAMGGAAPPSGAQGGGAPPAVEPGRPYANLTLMERREFWNKADGEWKKKISEAGQMIKHMGERAAHGDLPPEAELSAIKARVESYGDEKLAAQYNAVVTQAQVINRVMSVPPAAAEAFAKQQRTAVTEATGGRYSEEQAAILGRLDKAAETVRKNVNEDAMTWAHRRQLEVPTGDPVAPGTADEAGRPVVQPMRKVEVKPINFDPRNGTRDAEIQARFAMARDVGRYYGQVEQVFTKAERDMLRDVVAKGGGPMLNILGAIVKNGGSEAMGAIREFSKDAPEAHMIGKLMVEGGDTKLIEDAAKELQRRSKDGDKYINKVDRKLADPDVSELMPALAKTPGMQDPVKHMTDAVYNYRHRYLGKDQFDPELYKKTMREVLGETTGPNGDVYGGVGTQGAGWFDGKSSSKVLVPSGVRQDSFDAMVGAMRSDDLAGMGTPTHGDGTPLTIREVQRAQWHSLGGGRYGLQLGTNAAGQPIFAGKDGEPFILDVTPLMPGLRKRKPEIFMDGVK